MTIQSIITTYNKKEALYKNGLTNHLNMGLLALYKMGASEARLHEYAKDYILDNDIKPLSPPKYEIREDNYDTYLGQSDTYSSYVQFFKEKAKTLTKENLLTTYINQLIMGAAGGAFHGIIRLSYAITLDDPDEIVKALAYMASSYKAFPQKNAYRISDAPISDIISMSKDPKIKSFKFVRPLIIGRMADMYDNEDFHNTVSIIAEDLLSLEYLSELAITLYGHTGDFTILHGLTSTHALHVLKPYIHDFQAVLSQHWFLIQLAYASTGGCAINKLPDTFINITWKALFEKTIQATDVHTIKLIYSIYCLSKTLGHQGLCKTLAYNRL